MRLVLIGLAAGFLSALFGVGGGVLVVPLLIVAAGYAAHRATGTSLAAILVTSVAGAATYALHGEVDAAAAALVGIPATVGAIAGTALQQRLTGRALSLLFALFLAVIGVVLLVT